MTTTAASAPVDEDLVRSLTEQLLAEHATDDDRTFFGAQYDLGLARVDNPRGLGGLDAPPRLQDVVDSILEAAGRRGHWMRNPMGIGMCGPTIVAWGTDEQKQRFLRPIFTAEEIWCQLFSEPGAGSDVAGLSTCAMQDGDEWIINGQKVWTSSAHISKWGLLLARTNPDAPKHKGLTAFIVDMHAPGVEVRPLRQMSGGANFNEVYFTDARTPDTLRVGPVGEGWKVGTATLMNERVSIGGNVAPRGSGPIAQALDAWAQTDRQDRAKRDELARLWIEAEVLRLVNIRSQANRQKGVPGPEGSVLKLGQALLSQRISSFTVDLLGPAGMLCSGYDLSSRDEMLSDPVIAFLSSQASTIAGGTSEVMRNILGERVLGLPREPGFDPNTPWSQIPRS